MAFCTKCGDELVDGDRFCRTCGSPVCAPRPSRSGDDFCSDGKRVSEPIEFERCPACGEPLSVGDKVCPACDYQIAMLGASNAVSGFVRELSEVEARASDGRVSYIEVVKEIDGASIPHTASGALAFLSIAEGRVCTSIRDYGQGHSAKIAVLQAWATKSRHVYDIARVSFSKEAEFADIERAYQKINAVAGAKGALGAVGTANERLTNMGCLGGIIKFYLVLFIAGLVLAAIGYFARALGSNVTLVLLVVVAVAACFILKKKNLRK